MDRYKVFPSGELGMHPTGNWTPYADAQATVEALTKERDKAVTRCAHLDRLLRDEYLPKLDVEAVERSIADRDHRIDELEREIEQLDDTVEALQAEKLMLERGVSAQSALIDGLQSQLIQRTADLEAAKREVVVWKEKAELRGKEACAQRAELERVSLLSSHNERRFEEVDKKYKELRTLIAALPKVEGEIRVIEVATDEWHVYDAIFTTKAGADNYAALLQHRQGMEG